MTRSLRSANTPAALAITAFGVWFLWQASFLREGPGYAAVGPRVFPLIVGLGILVSGLALVWEEVRPRPPAGAMRASPSPDASTDEGDARVAPTDNATSMEPTDWLTLGAMAGLLAAYVLLFSHLGFVVASTLFLVAGAWVLGSRSLVRDSLVGIGLSLAAYVVFTRLLGLELPTGPLDELLRGVRSSGG